MKFEIRVLLRNENTFVIETDDLVKVDQMIPILGNRFQEVVGLTVLATPDNFGSESLVLHQQRFA